MAQWGSVPLRIWAINDNWEPVPDAVIRWRIFDAQGAEQAAGQEAAMAEDSVRQLGNVEWTATGRGRISFERRFAIKPVL